MRKLLAILMLSTLIAHPLDSLLRERGAPDYEVVLEKALDTGERVYVLKSMGMEWRGMRWFHRVGIVVPKNMDFTDRAFVLIVGGSRYVEDKVYYEKMMRDARKYAWIARSFESPFVVVADVPNQPIWGLKEDELIAQTFEMFLEDPSDETLPLLVPMTYGVIRAIDSAQDFLKRIGHDVEYFMVSGASKRGWTTYLVGIFDPRVFAIAPMVYDNLNIPEQLERQKERYGTYSEKIAPYTKRKLPERLGGENAKKLLKIVDPYEMRLRLSKPKILVMGTNDRYWTVDSVGLYIDDLPGETWVYYSPNDGHDITRVKDLVNTISAFYHLYPRGEFPRPEFEVSEGGICASSEGVKRVELWYAISKSTDFRDSVWVKIPSRKVGEKYCVEVPNSLSGKNVAFFSRVVYEYDGKEFYLSSPMELRIGFGKSKDR